MALVTTLLLAGSLLGVFSGFGSTARAQTPNTTLNFQARILLANGALVPDGNYHLEFKIYDTVSTGGTAQGAANAGNQLWIETRTTGNLVRVVNGYVSVNLGSVTPFPTTIPWGNNLYVTMRVGGNGGSAVWDASEMTNATTGRMKMSVAPVAFVANNLASGATSSASTNSSNVSITSGNATGATSNSGNLIVDTGTATGTTGTISLGSANASALTIGRAGITTTIQGSASFTGAGTGLSVTNNATIGGTLSIAGGTTYGVYFRDASNNVVTTAAGTTGQCFRSTTGAAPTWGSCSGTGDILQGGNTFGATAVIGTNDAFGINLITNGATAIAVDSTQNTTFNGNLTVAAGKSLTLTGGNTASRPATPTEGMLYFDTTTKQLLIYANGKWQADRSTATKIVADGSTSQNPERADYVVPAAGTSAQATINAAITALPASGGVVYLTEGTFIIDGSITLPNNVTLMGSGEATVIKLKDSTASAVNMISSTSTSAVKVANLRIDGNKAVSNNTFNHVGIYMSSVGTGLTASGATIDNVTVDNIGGPASHGIHILAGSNATITNSTVRGGTYKGIASTAANTIIRNNRVNNNGWYGIAVSGDDSSVVGNTLDSNVNYGILVSSGTRTAVTGNNVQNTLYDVSGFIAGIIVTGANTSYVTVAGNTTSGGYHGIVLYGQTHHNTVTGNTTQNNSDYGIGVIQANYNTITGNTITNVGWEGIILFYYANGNTVTGNNISYVGGSDSVAPATSATDSSGSGITLKQAVTNTVISGNKISQIGGAAIYFEGQVVTVDQTSIIGNSFTTNIPVPTTLAATITSSDTTITTGALTPEWNMQNSFVAQIDSEQIRFGGNYGTTTWGVINRGFNGTTAAAHTAGAAITQLRSYNSPVYMNSLAGVTNTYFADNTFNGTAYTSNFLAGFAGTGTRYANQQNNTAGDLVIKPGTDSATAFQIQNAAGTSIFNVNTIANRVEVSTLSVTNLEVPGDLVNKGITWTARTNPVDNLWNSVTYGNGMYVAVAGTGTGDRVMTSPDGVTWTTRTSPADNSWRSITYGNGLFVAVADSGTGNRVMTSPDGITWTTRVNPVDNNWFSVAYGKGLFVAVATTGTGDRVMTSPDGITWTIRTSAADNNWRTVVYGNGVFVATSNNGTGNRVMTSPDGITWTIRTSAADNSWFGLTYGNGLFVAVSTNGTGNRVMTSPDGITWTIRTSPVDNQWNNVTYGNGIFVATSATGTGNRVMTSPDGITWTIRTSAVDNAWNGITYGNGVFVAVARGAGAGNRIMTSGKADIIAVQNNNIYQGGLEVRGGLAVTFGNFSVTGTSVLGAQTTIGGTNDQTQLIVKANGSQTVANPLVLLQNSSSAELARINATTTSLYFGNAAGGSSAAGANNTGIGASALGLVSSGTGNTTLGSGALASVSVGTNNTAVGYNAGTLSTGSSNLFLGQGAGANATTGSNNIIIGNGLNASAAGVSNELRIGGVLQGDTSTLAAQFNGALTVSGATILNTTLAVTGISDFTGSIATKKGADYSSATVDNVNFGDVSLVRLTGASSQNITGIAGGRDGERLTIINASGFTASLVNNSASSSAGNKIITGTGGNVSIPDSAVVELVYDSTAPGFWRASPVSATGGAGVNSVGAVSATPTANGATITGTTLNLAVADGGNPGLVSTTAQVFGGAKTFSALITGNAGATITGAATSINANSNFNTSINTGTSTGTVTIGGGSAPLVIDSTNFDVSSAGAVSGVTTFNLSGAITGATSGNTINGLVVNAGALSGVTTINASGLVTSVGLTAGAGLIQGTAGLTVSGNTTLAATAGNTFSAGNTTGAVTLTGSSASTFVFNGVTVDTTEFNRLDGKDAALLDINDAVTTAITGTGALASGSIATGFGTITTANTITGTTLNGTTGINTGAGAGTQRIDASGNLVNIGTITSGLINGQTISSAANFTGSVTVANTFGVTTGATTLGGTLAVTGATTLSNSLTVQNATATDDQIITSITTGGAGRFAGTVTNADFTAARTFTLPDASGTFQLAPTSGNYLLQVPGSTAANTVSPTAASVVGLTVNGTTGTAANAFAVNQAGAATTATFTNSNAGAVNGVNITSAGTASALSLTQSGTSANGILAIDDTSGVAGVSLAVFKNSGVNAALILDNGYFYGQGVTNIATSNNSTVNTATTGTIITRNIADANTTLLVQQANAGSTGKILDLQNSGGSVVSISQAGGYTQVGSAANAFTGATTLSGGLTVNNATTTDDQIITSITTGGAARFSGTITNADLTAAQTYTLPNASGTFLLGAAAGASGNALVQVPTSNVGAAIGANIISPTAASIVALTVNGTTGTAATALQVTQAGAATGLAVTSSGTGSGETINLANTAGTQASGLAITRTGAGGTTTSLLDLTNSAGTVTNAINVTGTVSNILNSANTVIGAAGNFYGSSFNNFSTVNNSSINFYDTGTFVFRNVADGNSALTVQQGNAGSTGAILDLRNSGGVVVTIGQAGGYTQTGAATNTFTGVSNFTAAGTGLAVTNDTTVGGSTTLGSAAGVGQLTNNGSTVFATKAVLDDSDGGALGGTPGTPLTAAQSVDVYSSFSIAQTSGPVTITLPTPTSNTVYGRRIQVSNIGTVNITIGGSAIIPGSAADFVWSNTSGGATWQYAGDGGGSGNYIQNQISASQTGNSRITGSAQADTSVITPAVERFTAGLLSVGTTANTTSLTLGSTNSTATTLVGTTINLNSGTIVGNATTQNLFNTVATTLNVGGAATTVNIGAVTGTTTVNNNLAVTGTINTNAFTSTALTFSGANPIISASTAATGLTVQAPTTGTLTLNTVGAGTVNVGTTNTTTVGVGSATSATTVAGSTLALQGAAGGVSVSVSGTQQAIFAGGNTLYLGNALTTGLAAAPNAFTLATGSASGAATAGSAFTINSGAGNTTGAGGALTVKAGNGGASGIGGALILQGGNGGGTSGTATGGAVTIQGGNATLAGQIGGDVTLIGGIGGGGAGVSGVVFIDTPVFTATSLTLAQPSNNFAFTTVSTPVGITTTEVDNFSTVVLNVTGAFTGATIVLPAPTRNITGRVFYVTSANGSADFTLLPSGSSAITLKANSTATMVWNGFAWTAAGASASTTLQAAYDNTSTAAGAAEIILASSGTGGLTLRNSTTSLITGSLLEVQTNIGSNLISVNNNAAEFATNGGAETAGTTSAVFPATAPTWSAAPAGGSIAREVSIANTATGQASASVSTTGTAAQGVRNQLTTSLTTNLRYTASFAIKAATTNFSTLDIVYSADGTAGNGLLRHCVAGTPIYTTGLASQATTTITGTGGVNWTTIPAGSVIVFANGDSAAVVSTTATTITTAAPFSKTVASQGYAIYPGANTVTTSVWTRISCNFIAPAGATAANSIFIRQTDAATRLFYVDNLSVNVNASANHAADGSVDSALGTNWQVIGAASVSSVGAPNPIYDGNAAVRVASSAIGRGVFNNLSNGIVPQSNTTQYRVSFYARGDNTNPLTVGVTYAPNNGSATGASACTDYNTQTAAAASYTLITCLFTTIGTAIAPSSQLQITQTGGSATSFYVDALTITLNRNNSNNVQIGGANLGGPTTLFTLDRSAGAPIASNNDAYLGSMYYDTVTGRIQCYEADGWGACGAAPDNIVNLNPEYAGAVLNGGATPGVGTMTSDFCGNGGGLSANTALCAAGESRNYYRWTSPQATPQTYSIYVTYQLPTTFNGFSNDDTIQLTGRVDSIANAAVTYQVYRSTGSSITQCWNNSVDETVVAGAGAGATTQWYSVGINGSEATGCGFNSSAAGNFVIFKINMKANSNANAYVSTLSFVTTGR
jgi:parallel beta-helix repeat protein